MIDVSYILEHASEVADNARRRGSRVDVEALVTRLRERAQGQQDLEALRARANTIADSVASAEASEREALVQTGRALKEDIKRLVAELEALDALITPDLRALPNLLRSDVPDGQDEASNQCVRTWGEIKKESGDDHVTIAERLGILDLDRAAKVSGSRFVYLKGDGVRLELALVSFAMNQLSEHGFVPVLPPHLISLQAMGAMGYLERGGEEEIYHLKNDDLVLIGTSEQAIGPMHMDEILSEPLPLRYAGFSPCYRREAGSYGRDVRGILRVHQFDKVELFSFTTPDQSDAEHEFILARQEALMQALELPYRVMKLCAGDTGGPSARTYDIETWMPSQQTYRETHSTSNTTDYQTRRLKTRYRDAQGNVQLAHALNGTAFAIGRILIALLENNVLEDGSVAIPAALQPYMNGQQVLRPRDYVGAES